MLRFASMISAGLVLGCGAKSSLADLEQSAPPQLQGCSPGLLPGAAAPIPGYCSDRAGRATHELPRAPALLTSVATDSVSDSEPRVDERGRAYFPIDTNETDSAVLADTLIAVDPDGSLAASTPFEGVIGGLAIVADGTLRVVSTVWTTGSIERQLSRVSRGGEVLEQRRLPDGAGIAFAVGARGELVFTPTGNEDAGRVVATSTRGELLWRSEPLNGYAEPAAISGHGRVIVSTSRQQQAEVIALDLASGALAWRFSAAGYAGPPAIAPDGSVRVPLGSPDLSSQELLALAADGGVRFRTALPGNAVTVGAPTCVDALGRSFVRTRDALVAVDAGGSVLFTRELHPNGTFSCATDPTGALFYASLGFAVLDPNTESTLWSLEDGFVGSPPGTLFFAGPAVVAAARRLVLMDHGGSVHFIGD